ncbi:MAG: AAA family ATPase [Bacteroidales bacterium]
MAKTKARDEIETYNLAAKYRPVVLEDFVGQDAAIQSVQGWIKMKRFPASILVHGLTGSGKTTFAKLVARIVNCKTFSACGKCEYCSHGDDLPDLFEINAGTNGKVEDVENLIRAAKQVPRFRRRVILIDESHLMSDKAESNLLVPTETPSKSTIFIFCTTDPEKMKQTMRNRCTQIAIKPIDDAVIVKRLQKICVLENVKIKDKKEATKALKVIAAMSEGQMRYALSQLDALISAVSGGEKFSEESVMKISSSIMNTDVDGFAVSLLTAILRNNLENTITIVKKAGDARRLITRARYLIDWIIDDSLGLIPYTPAIGRMWQAAYKAQEKAGKPVEYSIAALIKIQHAMLAVDHKILSTPAFPALTALYTELANLSVDDYFLNILGKTPSDSKPKKKKK